MRTFFKRGDFLPWSFGSSEYSAMIHTSNASGLGCCSRKALRSMELSTHARAGKTAVVCKQEVQQLRVR